MLDCHAKKEEEEETGTQQDGSSRVNVCRCTLSRGRAVAAETWGLKVRTSKRRSSSGVMVLG